MSKVILVDGKNAAWRAHFVHWRLSSHRRPTSVIFGMTHMLMSLQSKLPYPMIIVWDGKGETWRHKITKDREKKYKGNRGNLIQARGIVNKQVPIVQKLYSDIGIWNFEVNNLEADDLIGILSKFLVKEMKVDQVIIYSGDRDYYQLLSDKIVICNGQGKGPKKNEILTSDKVEKEWGLKVKDYPKMRAFCGDHSDNIGQVCKKLGPKTAVKLVLDGADPRIKRYKDVPDVVKEKYEEKFQLKTVWPMVIENYHLSKIITDPLDNHLSGEVTGAISDELERLSKTGIGRNKKLMNMDSYRSFLEFMVDFELDELFTLRSVFWGLK